MVTAACINHSFTFCIVLLKTYVQLFNYIVTLFLWTSSKYPPKYKTSTKQDRCCYPHIVVLPNNKTQTQMDHWNSLNFKFYQSSFLQLPMSNTTTPVTNNSVVSNLTTLSTKITINANLNTAWLYLIVVIIESLCQQQREKNDESDDNDDDDSHSNDFNCGYYIPLFQKIIFQALNWFVTYNAWPLHGNEIKNISLKTYSYVVCMLAADICMMCIINELGRIPHLFLYLFN